MSILIGAADETLLGCASKTVLASGQGDDTPSGGRGRDDLTGGAGVDVVRFALGAGTDVIQDFERAKI